MSSNCIDNYNFPFRSHQAGDIVRYNDSFYIIYSISLNSNKLFHESSCVYELFDGESIVSVYDESELTHKNAEVRDGLLFSILNDDSEKADNLINWIEGKVKLCDIVGERHDTK